MSPRISPVVEFPLNVCAAQYFLRTTAVDGSRSARVEPGFPLAGARSSAAGAGSSSAQWRLARTERDRAFLACSSDSGDATLRPQASWQFNRFEYPGHTGCGKAATSLILLGRRSVVNPSVLTQVPMRVLAFTVADASG